jgi:hypothetical protein
MAQVRHKVVNEAWSVIGAVDDNADGYKDRVLWGQLHCARSNVEDRVT